MSWEIWAASIVFVITYALISLRRLPGIEITTWQASLFGAVLMLVIGAVSLDLIPEYVNSDILLLLLGMMLLVASLDVCGFFDITAGLLMRCSVSGRALLGSVMVLSAVLSALVLNDAVVLLMTPAVIRCCQKAGCDPIPYLIAVFVSANIGSVATVIGNPQNAYIATSADIGFVTFSQYMVPLSLICLALSYVILLLMFGRRLDPEHPDVHREPMRYDRRLYPILAIMAAMIVMFALSHTLDIPLWSVAVAGGMLSYAIVATKGRKVIFGVVRRVDWGVLLFFIGLFIVMGGAVETGMIDALTDSFPGFSDGSPSIANLTIVTAILSNLISNVPCVILLDNMIPAGDLALWLTLAAASTLAGNMTMIGAAANVIVSEEAEKMSIRIDFWRFLRIGIPVSLVTLGVTYVYLALLF
jgi:Na+/H+ antiporter NhaD/arsenite permease-like protein